MSAYITLGIKTGLPIRLQTPFASICQYLRKILNNRMATVNLHSRDEVIFPSLSMTSFVRP